MRRRRRLPAEQVVWRAIVLALFHRQTTEEVLSTLDLALPDTRIKAVCKGAITRARTRLGQAPLHGCSSKRPKPGAHSRRWPIRKSGTP
ncbi:transposase domain-containing protein [Denitromonas sp.]|uniref:transposase domain-containing protein n=1 Tax=Denitromonas sp. TaxID=2734609 RepID=UPI001E04D1BA|nr:transposase domain-containing protein [Rhodocyclaceae bacterium]